MSVPRHWEAMELVVHRLLADRDRFVVVGALRCRPKGSWDSIKVPFLHIWHIRSGRVTRPVGSLDSVELRRAA
jgi:hypothetical protein